jgi:hypothetical protein
MTRADVFFAAALAYAAYWVAFTPTHYDGHVLVIIGLAVCGVLPRRRRA